VRADPLGAPRDFQDRPRLTAAPAGRFGDTLRHRRPSHRIDLRAMRPVAVGEGRHLELALELFNALHLLNPRWGSVDQLPLGISSQNPVVNRVPLLRIRGPLRSHDALIFLPPVTSSASCPADPRRHGAGVPN
jgi:hypothetical protein